MAPQETDRLKDSRGSVSGAFERHSALSGCQRLCYGVGHVLNDLTASMWFSYLLIFLHKVNKFDNFLAGNLMLIGQISDALFTPFIGLESDRTKGFCNLGKRKSWHLVGTFCVLASFVFLFMRCINCSHTPNIYQLIYYAPFVVIFQFGWASVQISHLSFSSDFTPYKDERVTLQSIRNMFTVFANLSLFGIFALLFYLSKGGGFGNNDHLSPDDAPKFRNLALICMGIGILFDTVFYTGTRERTTRKDSEKEQSLHCKESITSEQTQQPSKMTWREWLKEHQFYQLAVLYMSTRLYINVSQVYFPMYLTDTIDLGKIYIALMPLFVYCASFLFSVLSPFMNRLLGRKATYFIGILLAAASCIWMILIPSQSHQVYGSAILLGAAGSVLLITSLSMLSDLIAANTESGAFVFGAMSFTDKLSNGIAIELIQKFHPVSDEFKCSECDTYYRQVMGIIPGAAIGLAFIAFLTLLPQNIGVRRQGKENMGPEDNITGDQVQCSCGQFYTPPGGCVHCVVSGEVRITTAHPICGQQVSDDDDESSPLMNGGFVNARYRDVKEVKPSGHVQSR